VRCLERCKRVVMYAKYRKKMADDNTCDSIATVAQIRETSQRWGAGQNFRIFPPTVRVVYVYLDPHNHLDTLQLMP